MQQEEGMRVVPDHHDLGREVCEGSKVEQASVSQKAQNRNVQDQQTEPRSREREKKKGTHSQQHRHRDN